MKRTLIVLSGLALATGMLFAQQNRPEHSSGKPPEPPAEAFAACKGKSEGDRVTVQTQDQTIHGTCTNFNGKLALKPDGHPPKK